MVSKINFHPENWGSDEPKFDSKIFGIFASADAEKLRQLTLRSQKALKRVTKSVISLKLTAKAPENVMVGFDDPKSGWRNLAGAKMLL